jgi:hypothetical protein
VARGGTVPVSTRPPLLSPRGVTSYYEQPEGGLYIRMALVRLKGGTDELLVKRERKKTRSARIGIAGFCYVQYGTYSTAWLIRHATNNACIDCSLVG